MPIYILLKLYKCINNLSTDFKTVVESYHFLDIVPMCSFRIQMYLTKIHLLYLHVFFRCAQEVFDSGSIRTFITVTGLNVKQNLLILPVEKSLKLAVCLCLCYF